MSARVPTRPEREARDRAVARLGRLVRGGVVDAVEEKELWEALNSVAAATLAASGASLDLVRVLRAVRSEGGRRVVYRWLEQSAGRLGG